MPASHASQPLAISRALRRGAGGVVRLPVEPREHGRGEPVVEAVPRPGRSVRAAVGIDLPVDRAGGQRIGDPVPREQAGRLPPQGEG
jgi:hypothetical protein